MIRASRLIEAIKALAGDDDPMCCVTSSAVLQVGNLRLSFPVCPPKQPIEPWLLTEFSKIDNDTKVFKPIK
jgi:hypothetical protein